MMGWEVIETAPKGVWIYVICQGALCGGVAMLGDYWINPSMERDPYAERATHWMPLPAPPTN